MPAEIGMQNGMVEAPKPGLPGSTPVGAAGSIPSMKKAPSIGGRPAGTGGAPAPAKPPVNNDPYEKLNKDTLNYIKLLIAQGIQEDILSEDSDGEEIRAYLARKGWDSNGDDQYLLELMQKYKVQDLDEFFKKILSGELTGDMQQDPAAPKPDGTLSGVNQNPSLNTKGSSFMGRVFIKDGQLVTASAVDAAPVLDNLYLAIRKVEAGIQKVAQAKLIKYAEDMGGDAIDGIKDLAGGSSKGGSSVEDAVKKLKDAVEDLSKALDVTEDFKSDNDDILGHGPAKDLDSGLKDGKDTLDKADKAIGADLPVVDKSLDSKPGAIASAKGASKQAGFPFEKKDDEKGEKKEEKDEKKDEPESKKEEKSEKDEKKEAASGDVKSDPGSATAKEAGEVIMGTKGPEGSKANSGADIKPFAENKMVKASEILADIQAKLAAITDENGMIKEAQLYPFKDLNKQNQDPINAQTAKSQISECNSEIKGQPKTDKTFETIAPKGIADGGLKADYENGAKKTVDIKIAEVVRKRSLDNALSKAKLAFALASKQQLKGLLDNPMKTAMVNNMVDAGITKEAAEIIAHNALIDGYEPSQQIVIKEAFDTFMKRSMDEFTEIDKATNEYTSKEAGFVQQTAEETVTKTASAQAQDPLQDRQAAYSNYWTQVAAERGRRPQ